MPINWTTVFTISGAFGAASTAQVVSHFLTKNRDERKYLKECLQKLYSPLIFRIIDYLHAESLKAVSKDEFIDDRNDIDADNAFNEILEKIGQNLMYANNDLIMEYEQAKSFPIKRLIDDDTEMLIDQRIRICEVFISQYIEINKELKTLSESIEYKLRGPYFFTQFYLLVVDCLSWELVDSETILKYMGLTETIMKPNNDLLARIIKIRKEISIESKTNAYKGKIRGNETYLEALHFLYDVCDAFSIETQVHANFWRDALDKQHQQYTG